MSADASKPPLLGTAREWTIDLSVAVVIGILLGLMGPFGSFFNDGPAVRVAYWVCSILFGTVVFGTLTRLGTAGARRLGTPDWAVLPPVILVGTVLLGAPLRLFAIAFWPGVVEAVPLTAWFGQCLAISTPLVVGAYFLRARQAGQASARPAVIPSLASTPSDATPSADTSNVLYLRMEDHYVRIRTEQGSRLEMGPLARVTAMLTGIEGLQTHRSWWVARRAIAGVVRDGRNLRLRLVDGETAPVSRASVAKLRAAGWLADDAE
ncbi:DNA-binding response regulator [Caulobacter vibrioides]|uniref:LytTR family DNA-binding domain-containing protein n=1 Tax=Caulobacter vibrioides TaxID=155892 RepID=UPI000BB51DEF|nr:LytTR family DNA-binding domain-containing protein [Caulobacter vibrioides]ATC25924.1 DNA-binding response regulator [Caulobacter vibrioides]AZH14070.1 DNA-binding response regulator [Caulobacter vibrioides]PLR16434.1 DNA-binding response regulator [Caulobacter vibrioides]